MYFAHMYCFGWDHDLVGITGIKSCMGVVFQGSRTLYAIHIPDNSTELNALGCNAFAKFVLGGERPADPKKGQLLAFANGNNHPSAEQEVATIQSLLNGPKATLYRYRKHLTQDPSGLSADSATTMVKHTHTGLILGYKHIPDAAWNDSGKPESGQYKHDPRYQGRAAPINCWGGWNNMDAGNCTIIKIK